MTGETKGIREKVIKAGNLTLTWKKNKYVVTIPNNKGEEVPYLINENKVKSCHLIPGHKIMILTTKEGNYYRDLNNFSLDNSDKWADFYFDHLSLSFYRKDDRGYWYDLEGFRLESNFILKGSVLISLEGRETIKNSVFEDQEPVMSPNGRFVQVGRIVMDINLEILHYYNERITGLGEHVVHFDDGTIYQEVILSLKRRGFINEATKKPISINGKEVNYYQGSRFFGSEEYHIFSSLDQEFLINSKDQSQLDLYEKPHKIILGSYQKIGNLEVLKIATKYESFYCDIFNKIPLSFDVIDSEQITNISNSQVVDGGSVLFNVESKQRKAVIRSKDKSLFTGKNSDIHIEEIESIAGFENKFAYVTTNNKKNLFSLHHGQIIELGYGNHQIKEIAKAHSSKLVNATSTTGKKLVLDLRRGEENITLAMSGEHIVTEMLGETATVGSKVLQNAKVETLGGEEKCVLNLNDAGLHKFSLPEDMKAFAYEGSKSVFAGVPYQCIDFNSKITLDQLLFYKAYFRSYDDELQEVIIQEKNGQPLHFDGLGHKNELITGFSAYTITERFHLGSHRMIGATTLKENLKKDELLFALDLMSSWLPFFDSYLPIFKRIVKLKATAAWQYHLFELRAISSEKEYIAVEKNSPFRILVENSGNQKSPLVVKSNEKILKSPEEISAIKKVFVKDPGVLVDVY